jgi:hypothetical protein
MYAPNKTYNFMLGVGFEALTAVVLKSSIFGDIKPCSLLELNRRFGETCRLCLPPAFLLCLFFDPEDGGDMFLLNFGWDRAVAQAVSRRLPNTAAPIRAQVRSCGICGEQGGTGAGFLRILRFPLPILILPTAPHSSSIYHPGLVQ